MIDIGKKFVVVALASGALMAIAFQPQVAAAQPDTARSQLVASYNASGQQLLQKVAASRGNIVFSPYSIGTALSMALSGARADTEREMLDVLHHRLDRPQIDTSNRELLAILNNYDKSAVAPSCPTEMQVKGQRCQMAVPASGFCPYPMSREGDQCFGGATLPASARLLLANALMVVMKDTISEQYAALLKEKYAADLFRNATLSDVNGWVSRKTEGKIDKILENLSGTAAILLNAVYFKSRWAAPFDEKLTKNEAFHLSSNQRVQVSMMSRTGDYALVTRAGYRAIRLPYAVRPLGMLIVLPNEVEGLPTVLKSMDGTEQTETIAALRSSPMKPVAVSLPRFKTEYKADLVPHYRQAGMQLAFDKDRADFSGMTARPAGGGDRLYIGNILHRAMIEVSEESTEAAAATAVTLRPTGAAPPQRHPEPEIFRVDRPFLFYIVDETTGAILFGGRIADPRQQA